MSSLEPKVNAERIAADIEAIAGFSESDQSIGHDRPTFSPSWAAARDYVIEQAAQAGAEHRIDPSGNVHIRNPQHAGEQVWLSGSHVDSVPSGGRYDGVMGVVVPLEILRAHPELPVELIIFAEEEGTTFGVGMLGSRGWSGDLNADDLAALHNRDGANYLEAGAPFGVAGDQIAGALINPSGYIGLVEVHAEQGRSLWDAGKRVAAVRLINGRRQYGITVTGEENHAGSTAMPGRRDALAGAARMVVALEALAHELGRGAVITVGSLAVQPDAVNVIAGSVEFTIDFRAPEQGILESGNTEIGSRLRGIADERGLGITIDVSEEIAPMPLSDSVCTLLTSAAASIGEPIETVTSGALHDAAILAPLLPTAMIFVASRDGISHNPDEFSRVDDIALAARILVRAIADSVDQ